MYKKILVIGQAPPAVKQSLPYDTTMFYDWLKEIGVEKSQALVLFDFDAVYDVFTGFSSNGSHLKPTISQMDDYWQRKLEDKVMLSDKIILLGNVAKDYFYSKEKRYSCNTQIIELIHPSKRNYSLYIKNKEQILSKLKNIINQ